MRPWHIFTVSMQNWKRSRSARHTAYRKSTLRVTRFCGVCCAPIAARKDNNSLGSYLLTDPLQKIQPNRWFLLYNLHITKGESYAKMGVSTYRG